ncbi:uncharacterized protein BDZ99DRAFT_566653 [Mytilinidion resinicola]|uniref:C2H2-type domain-containing protein n=1 Tax=Mytilinidion resinicola TaxID=574789 RepID=A0A6A6Z347_9PEZI|nr:uncharacterized protein BDZ99DRAFT_566653 [Mytilinidion resinicola]KAF2814704.1 hypothetical protein BDZ99DRAFT_566653 [Mytilinidion resinicola]
MPYDIPSHPKLLFPPSPIVCVPKALGLSWANYERDFREHQDRDLTRVEAGSVLGGAMLRQYFSSLAGFRRGRAYLGYNWGTAEMTPETEVVEDVAVEDMAMWIVEKRREEEGTEEGVIPSVEVQDDNYDVHTILIVVTHAKFMAKKDRRTPTVLPFLGPGFVVGGREVRYANVVVLTGDQRTVSPQFEFYKLDLDGPKEKSLVPALGTTEEYFGTNAFRLGKTSAEKMDKMWKAAAKGELKMKGKLKMKTKATERNVEPSLDRSVLGDRSPDRNSSIFSLAHLDSFENTREESRDDASTHIGTDIDRASESIAHASKSIFYPSTIDTFNKRKRKQSSRALSAEASEREESVARDMKKRKTTPAISKPKANRRPKNASTAAMTANRDINKATPPLPTSRAANAFASSAGKFSEASPGIRDTQPSRSYTPQSSAGQKRKRPTPEPLSPIFDSPVKLEPTDAAEARPKKPKKSSQLAAIDAALRRPAFDKRFCCPYLGCAARYSTKDSVRRHFKQMHPGLELDMAAWQYTTPDGIKIKGQHVATASRAGSQPMGGEVGLGGGYQVSGYGGLTSKKTLSALYKPVTGGAGVEGERADSAVAGDDDDGLEPVYLGWGV